MVDALGLTESDWPVPLQSTLGDRNGPGAWAEYFAMRATLAVTSRLPLSAQERLIDALAGVAMRVDRRHTAAAREFATTALGHDARPERVEELTRGSWRHLVRIAIRDHALEMADENERMLERARVEMCEDARRIVAERIPAFMVTAHLGDWEYGGAALPWLGFKPLYVVSRPPRNRPLSRMLEEKRTRHHVRLIRRQGAIENITRVIEGRGYVLLMLDQRARHKPIKASFFGRPAKCERSIPVLVRRLRAPVVFWSCTMANEPYRYEIRIPRVLWPEDLRGQSPLEIVTRINAELEHLILARPEQYMWLHDRYEQRKRPPVPRGAVDSPPARRAEEQSRA